MSIGVTRPNSSPSSTPPPGASPTPAGPTEVGAGTHAQQADGIGGTTGVSKPTVKFDDDTIAGDADALLSLDTGGLGEPALPPAEGKPEGSKQDQTQAVTAMISSFVTVAQDNLTPGTLTDVLGYYGELKADPSKSAFLQLLPPDIGATVVNNLTALPVGQTVDLRGVKGEQLSSLLTHQQAQGINFMINILTAGSEGGKFMGLTPQQLEKGALAVPDFFSAFADVTTNGGVVTPEMVEKGSAVLAEHDITSDANGAEPTVSMLHLFNQDGTIDPAKASEAITNAILLGEAGFDTLVMMFSKFNSDDSKLSNAVMQDMLKLLRAQKENLVGQLREKKTEMIGKEFMSAVQMKAAEEAKAKAECFQIVMAVVMVVVAIVVAVIAVVAAIFTGGSSLVAAFLIIAAIAACLSAVCTIVVNMPYLMMAVGADEAGKKMQKWMGENAWFGTMMQVIQITCAVVGLVCGIGAAVAAANAASTAASAAAQAAAEAASKSAEESLKIVADAVQKAVQGISREAAEKVAQAAINSVAEAIAKGTSAAAVEALKAAALEGCKGAAAEAVKALTDSIKYASQAVQVANGGIQVGAAVAQHSIQQDLIQAEAAVQEIKLQIAAIDIAIEMVKVWIDEVSKEEDQGIEDVKTQKEMNEQLRKAAAQMMGTASEMSESIISIGRR